MRIIVFDNEGTILHRDTYSSPEQTGIWSPAPPFARGILAAAGRIESPSTGMWQITLRVEKDTPTGSPWTLLHLTLTSLSASGNDTVHGHVSIYNDNLPSL